MFKGKCTCESACAHMCRFEYVYICVHACAGLSVCVCKSECMYVHMCRSECVSACVQV
jgi:hypothetical protein